METHGVVARRRDQIHHTVDDLDQRVDERLERLLQRGLAHHVHPQAKTVHELPVVHRVDATRELLPALLLRLGHGGHRVAHMDGELTDVHERVLIRRHGVHGVQLRHAVPHHDKGLTVVVVVLLPRFYECEIHDLSVMDDMRITVPSESAP